MTVTYSELSAKGLVIEKHPNPTQFENHSDLPSSRATDYLLEVTWTIDQGWGTPSLHPYGPLSLDPASSVLHYATTCFEGMKAYRSFDGKKVTLFRPLDNINRLNDSCARASLPQLEPNAALALLEKFVEMEARFIAPGSFIYLRPMVMGTNAHLGLTTPTEAKFLIMASMMPKLNAAPLKLCSSPPDQIRAWKGGFGYAKLGANYGPTLKANNEAIKNGFSQVLWLMGEEGIVTEAGGANFFAVIKNEKTGKDEIMTCPLTTGVILPGVTRRSVLELLRNKYTSEGVEVNEKEFTISDIEKASDEGRLVEAFAVGTAYFIAPVQTIRTPAGKDISVPMSIGTSGDYAHYIKETLSQIMWSKVEHPWSHPVASAQ
ncbi:branched-chain-amino-acid transaminase BAT1 [Sugiyamaella lignohabitans]|uniref:Branched-chain-amino-acid aminotransferase n=1 Tax=Sugiyamaella lignohabitans TaxID=796027 RepID=A0A167EY33_9ASCO|nr:branched-chain-amino-acid transaminase BAT1 [Sugiyamaella lignohabitans]ANB14595.1 branched-chain-amino-acid transaminase BAT1 [Sugiyamaella lignohabitans]